MSNLPSEPEFEQAYKGTSSFWEATPRLLGASTKLQHALSIAPRMKQANPISALEKQK